MEAAGVCEMPPMLNLAEKKEFLEKWQHKQKELVRRQREYRKLIGTRLKTRTDLIVDKSYDSAIENLCQERDGLRAELYVANGPTHKRNNAYFLEEIQCHVNCQEHLAHDIKKLKLDIPNMEREIGRLDKQVYDLNRKTIPDARYQAFVEHTRKILSILEDQLETGIHRECSFIAINASLREELLVMLNQRAFFNEIYGKLIQKLNSDKKYLIDIIQYAMNTFENCIEIYEKLEYVETKDRRDRDQRKIEMQSLMRSIAAAEEDIDFFNCKGKIRPMADLQLKEYKRRETFKRNHIRKIELYKSILQKIFQYTDSHNVEEVIKKFQEQESIYYSYFTYANEMSFHMTIMHTTVNRLYADVNTLKEANRGKYNHQIETIAALEKELETKKLNNREWEKAKDSTDERINFLLGGIQSVVRICNVNTSSLLDLLGDHTEVNLVNVRRFLKLLEKRLTKLVASAYIIERMDSSKSIDKYVVRGVLKIQDYLTNLDDIVITQQCPECAEGEALNNDERGGEGGIIVLTKEEATKGLYEKIQQPEMQYRLHSLSACRLPRSRVLTAKRNA